MLINVNYLGQLFSGMNGNHCLLLNEVSSRSFNEISKIASKLILGSYQQFDLSLDNDKKDLTHLLDRGNAVAFTTTT